jgi:PAS domain S-box-containing protein
MNQRSQKEIEVNLEVEFEQRMQELSFAQAQIGAIFENSPLGIGTAALDGTILSANPAMARIFGYDEEEILQINIDDFFPDRGIRNAIMQKLVQERIVKMPRLQLQRKDGTLIHVNLTESLLTREDQDVLLGVVDDITDQVLAEKPCRNKLKPQLLLPSGRVLPVNYTTR